MATAKAKKPAAKTKPAAPPPASAKRKSVKRPSGKAAPAPPPSKTPRRPAARKTDTSRGKYVYCVIHSSGPLSFGPVGIGVESPEVHTVRYKDIAAVVSDTPLEAYEPTRANVLAHERVNETVMREHTVIPMSFGTVFKTSDDILELLRSAYDAFKDVLVKMEDKLEFGLKVLWDRDLIVRELESEDEDIRRLKTEITSQKGSTYFARMQYGRLVDASLQARSERYVQEIFEALRPVSVANRRSTRS